MSEKNTVISELIALTGEGSGLLFAYSGGGGELLDSFAAACGRIFVSSAQCRDMPSNASAFTPGDGSVPLASLDAAVIFEDEAVFNDRDGNFNMPCYKLGQLLKPGCRLISVMKKDISAAAREKAEKAFQSAGLLEPEWKEAGGYMLLTALRARNPDEKKAEVYGIWNAWAPNYNEYHKDELAGENLTLWRSVLRRVIDAPEGSQVLDIGTGTGFLSIMASELGYKSFGIDFSEQMLEFAGQNSKLRNAPVTFVRGDGDVLPFENEEFSAVMNSRVLWTCVDPEASIKEWMRVTKTHGRIISFTRTGEDIPKENSMMDKMLPLSNATTADYIEVYRRAGLKNVVCEKLPEEMSVLAGPVWYVITGEKE